MSRFLLSERADGELLAIYLYGIEAFGRPQAIRYLDSLETCFERLAGNPRIGRNSDSIASGLRRHEHGSHVILYEELADGVEIVGLVHHRAIRGLKL